MFYLVVFFGCCCCCCRLLFLFFFLVVAACFFVSPRTLQLKKPSFSDRWILVWVAPRLQYDRVVLHAGLGTVRQKITEMLKGNWDHHTKRTGWCFWNDDHKNKLTWIPKD